LKYLVLLILLFDGELVTERISYPMFLGCFDSGHAHIETIATHKWGVREGPPNFKFDGMRQGWYLHDRRGTVQGFYCE